VSDDEARRFMAEHAHYTEDLPFWRAAAARLGSPVLDLGAAAGRVALDLARAGHRVVALDRSVDMVAEIGRRLDDEIGEVRERVTLVVGDLRTLDLGRRFPLVLVAMNTLQVLTEADDRLACLRGIAAHLSEGGELIFDVALPDVEEITSSMGVERAGGRFRDPITDATLTHSAWYDRWEPASQTLGFTLRIEERTPGARPRETLRHHTVHLFSPQEIGDLVERAGLVHLAAIGDFDGSPIGPRSERQIHRCGPA
jgi:SAM-dependent methyltransferase